jgi:hypothetical protein
MLFYFTPHCCGLSHDQEQTDKDSVQDADPGASGDGAVSGSASDQPVVEVADPSSNENPKHVFHFSSLK